jgi:hypothetical protein
MSAIVPKSQRAHYLMITAIAKYLKKWMTYKCVNSTLKTIFLQKKNGNGKNLSDRSLHLRFFS